MYFPMRYGNLHQLMISIVIKQKNKKKVLWASGTRQKEPKQRVRFLLPDVAFCPCCNCFSLKGIVYHFPAKICTSHIYFRKVGNSKERQIHGVWYQNFAYGILERKFDKKSNCTQNRLKIGLLTYGDLISRLTTFKPYPVVFGFFSSPVCGTSTLHMEL